MHALVYTGTEKIEYREEKDPITKPGETLIKVQACTFINVSPGLVIGSFSSLYSIFSVPV